MLYVSEASLEPLDLRIAPARVGDLPCVKAWTALAGKASEPNPFLEHWFLEPALRHLKGDEAVWLAQGWKQGELIGLMPLSVAKGYGRVPVRYTSNWMHFQCFIGSPLIRAGHEEAWFTALLQALDKETWAKSFLSFAQFDAQGPLQHGLIAAAAALGRPAPIVHRKQRAKLESEMGGVAYLDTHVRSKKRKEWRRLGNRIAEMGTLILDTLDHADDVQQWCDAFLALEASGWKGQDGAALANTAETETFFREMMARAFASETLEFLRLVLNDRAIAMLINFRTPPGSWSFKIAYDEELSRFSPGVMIEIENLMRVLADPEIDWMDSCAVEDHPMIDKLWAERRELVQISVPLAGLVRRSTYAVCRAAETASATVKGWLL